MDWLRQMFTGKRRKLTKQTAESIQSQAFFDSNKIQATLDFKFKPLKQSIERVSKRYVKSYKRS